MKIIAGHSSVISLAQKSSWTKYVSASFKYDFYHTWHYHTMDKSGEPFLFVYEEGKDYIAFPLLKRKIPNSTFFDLSSVYGFTGPISNKKFENLNDTLIQNFKSSFLKFLDQEKIVSVFSRLHPFFNQLLLFDKLEGIHENGKTVVIDLSIPIEEQRKKYRVTTYDSIKKARKLGFTTREMNHEKDIVDFMALYLENMERLEANDSYKFDEKYFTTLLSSNECNAKLILTFFEEKMIGGTIITFTNGIIQAHLIACHQSYLKYSPSKFLVDEISLLGREKGMKYYNLGGGLGFKEDSLFKWKTGFSDFCLAYRSLRYIFNRPIYNSLINEKGIAPDNNVDFFPLYRCSNFVKIMGMMSVFA